MNILIVNPAMSPTIVAIKDSFMNSNFDSCYIVACRLDYTKEEAS